MNFEKGDLVYVPQDVLLFGEQKRFRTSRPTTAVFIEEERGFTYKILVGASPMSVKRSHIYPLKELSHVS